MVRWRDLHPEFSENQPVGAKIFLPMFESGSKSNTELTNVISKEYVSSYYTVRMADRAGIYVRPPWGPVVIPWYRGLSLIFAQTLLIILTSPHYCSKMNYRGLYSLGLSG